MAEMCPYHLEHETRLKNLEKGVEALEEEDVKMKERIGNPAIWVALVSFMGVCVTASASFAAVILAPVLRVWLGIN